MPATKKAQRIKTNILATHKFPHIDEIVAIWLLIKFGINKFIGLKKAKLEFWNGSDQDTVIHQNVTDWDKRGIIPIGIGGGRFDEHKSGEGTTVEECAATLVARYLGIKDDPALKKILEFTLNNDRKGASHPFDIASVIKALYQQYPDDPMVAIKWTFAALDAKYHEQNQFWTVTKQIYKKATITEIDFYGKRIKLAIMETDDAQAGKYARLMGVAIVIQKNSSGNIQIFTSKKIADFKLFDVVRILRVEEQKRRSDPDPITDWKKLAAEGMLSFWYYQKEAEAIFNGSLTHTDITPTMLGLETIKNAVTIGINPKLLEKNCPITSGKKHCTKQKCPWYRWGLSRCSKIRYQMNNN